MPEIIITYDNPKTLKVLEVLSESLDFVISKPTKTKRGTLGNGAKEQIEKPPTKEEFINGLRDAIEDVKLINAGQKEGKSFQQFLDEL